MNEALRRIDKIMSDAAERAGDDNGESRLLLMETLTLLDDESKVDWCSCTGAESGDDSKCFACRKEELVRRVRNKVTGVIRPIGGNEPDNPAEHELVNSFKEINDEPETNIAVVVRILKNKEPSQRDTDCVTATIQWLGSTEGQQFLEESTKFAGMQAAAFRDLELDASWWSRLSDFENESDERKATWVEKVCKDQAKSIWPEADAARKRRLARSMASLILRFTNGEFAMPAAPMNGDGRHITLGDDE